MRSPRASCAATPRRSGSTSSFTILDTDDQLRLLKQIIAAANIDERRWPARALLGIIERWKDRGLAPDKVPAGDAGDWADGRAVALYRDYQERLATVNAVDFGDLLLHNLTLFSRQPRDPRRLISGASAICWSTSTRTPTSRSICGCGCWRSSTAICAASATTTSRSTAGAAPRSATSCKFESDFPGALIVRLEENYRSTPEILARRRRRHRA